MSGIPIRLVTVGGECVDALPPRRRRKRSSPSLSERRETALWSVRSALASIDSAAAALASLKALLDRPLDPVTVAALLFVIERELRPAAGYAANAVTALEMGEP